MTRRSPEHVIAMVEAYALAATESRVDDLAALFAEDAALRDPYDGEARHGREAIRAFFAAGAGMIEHLAVNGSIRTPVTPRARPLR